MEARIKGSELKKEDQAYVLSTYIHRFTKDHFPEWANVPNNAPNVRVQFASDEEWLANTYFVVTKKGRLDKRSKNCHSYPTWPNNPELRK